MTKHTETPWRADGHVVWSEASPTAVCQVNVDPQNGLGIAQAVANAELIVRCVNAHGDLLAACELALPRLHNALSEHLPGHERKWTIEAKQAVSDAIAKAKGQ